MSWSMSETANEVNCGVGGWCPVIVWTCDNLNGDELVKFLRAELKGSV